MPGDARIVLNAELAKFDPPIARRPARSWAGRLGYGRALAFSEPVCRDGVGASSQDWAPHSCPAASSL